MASDDQPTDRELQLELRVAQLNEGAALQRAVEGRLAGLPAAELAALVAEVDAGQAHVSRVSDRLRARRRRAGG